VSGTARRLRKFLSILVLGLVGPSLALAPAPTAQALAGASAEVRVNTTVVGNQLESDIAVDADGDYVVTWSSDGQDGSGDGVYAQRYNAAGAAQGGEWQVNTTTTNDQYEPSVAMDADGDFVITWTSIGQDGSGHGVYAQRYNAAGTAQGAETKVNVTTTEAQFMPSVAMDADGDYVIAWTSYLQDGSDYGIYAQRYNAAGATQGGETQVNSTTPSSQDRPTVAMSADGDYVIAWSSLGQDTSAYGIYSRRYNAAGAVQGSETRVNTTTANSQYRPSAAMAADGDYVITWTSHLQDGSDNGVYAQRYNASGATQGAETLVNTTVADYQLEPKVAMDADGDYVVAWASAGQDGGGGYGTYTQRYNARGAAQGGETRVNTTTAGSQNQPSIAMDADGDQVVSWTSSGQDSSGDGVYARRFRGPEAVDLRLTQTDNGDPIAVGGRLVYRIRVFNRTEPQSETGVPAIDSALGVASGIQVVTAPPGGASFQGVAGDGWVCGTPLTTMTCRLTTTLAAGEIAPTLRLSYLASTAAQTVQHLAEVADRHVDPVIADNIEVERTTVMCTVEFAHPSYSKSEFSSITATVTRHGTDCGPSSVRYDSSPGTASSADFNDVAGTLTWADVDTDKTFVAPLVDDTLDEATERFTLSLSDPVGALLAGNNLVTAYVGDNDDPPRINFTTTSATAAEPGALVEVTLRLSEVSGQPVIVGLGKSGSATAGSDYFVTSKVTIPAGQRTVTFTIEVADDAAVEGTETVVLTLTNPVAVTLGSLKTFTLTITSDD